MRKSLAVITGVLTVALCSLFVVKYPVYADGKVEIKADRDSANPGEQITFSVKVQSPEDAAAAPEISIEYNSNRLEFVECSTQYGGGGGGLLTLSDDTADITFAALSGGTARVSITAVFDGDESTTETAFAAVEVSGEDTAALMEPAPEETTAQEAGYISLPDGSGTISTVIPDECMPVLFHKVSTEYQAQPVEAAQFDMGDLLLLYVLDADETDGQLKIFDKETESFSDFRMIQGIENRFIIVLPDSGDALVPEGYSKAVLQWNSQTLTAYMNFEAQADPASQVSANDFFLLYAMSSEGTTGWYLYDQKEGTYQRFFMTGTAPADAESQPSEGSATAAEGLFGLSLTAFIIMASLAVLLLAAIIAIIIMAIKLREYGSYEYIDEDEYFAQNANAAKASEKPAAKSSAKAPAKDLTFTQEIDLEEEDVEEAKDVKTSDNAKTLSDAKAKKNAEMQKKVEEALSDDSDFIVDTVENMEEIIEEEEDDDEYYYDNLSREEKKRLKEEEKRLRKEEKQKRKDEKEAQKRRRKGYDDMDWEEFETSMQSHGRNESSKLYGGRDTGKMPSYMREYMEEGGVGQDEAALTDAEEEEEIITGVLPQKKVNEMLAIMEDEPEEIPDRPILMSAKKPEKPIEKKSLARADKKVDKKEEKKPVKKPEKKSTRAERVPSPSDWYGQEEYTGQYTDEMDIQSAQAAYTPPTHIPMMQPVQENIPHEDLDEDFEFEFIQI